MIVVICLSLQIVPFMSQVTTDDQLPSSPQVITESPLISYPVSHVISTTAPYVVPVLFRFPIAGVGSPQSEKYI